MTTLLLESPRTISLTAARLAIAGGAASIVLLAALHILEPEYAASWRMISEYANGAYGWVTSLYFLSLAAACLSLLLAVRREIRGVAGMVGLGLLALSAAGMTLAAFFAIDPITIRPEEGTFHGQMHAVSALLGVPSLPIAATLVSLALGRLPGWSQARAPLHWAAVATWVGLALMVGSVMILLPLNGGSFGPGAPIGWGNRAMMLAYAAWIIVAGWQAAQRAVR